MGKGKGESCGVSMGLVADHADPEEWAGFAQKEMSRILRSADPIDKQSGLDLSQQLLESFRQGDVGQGLAALGGRFRLSLAGLLISEGDSSGAVKLLSHPHVDVEAAGELLAESIEGPGVAPVDRSRYRHCLAQLVLSQGDITGAQKLLEDDVADPKVLPARHALARRKLEALASLEPAEHWLYELLPANMADPDEAAASVDRVINYGLESRKGFEAANNLCFKLQQEGFTHEALELSRVAKEAQEGQGGALPFIAASAYAGALAEDGRPDEAAAAFRFLADSSSGTTREAVLKKLMQVFDRAKLRDRALEVSREIRDEADAIGYSAAHQDLLSRLVEAGRFEQALAEAERPDHRDGRDQAERRQDALIRVLHADPPASERSRYRRELAQSFKQGGEVGLAEDVLEADLDDSEVSGQDKALSSELLKNL